MTAAGRDEMEAVTRLRVVRVDARGAAELELTAPRASRSSDSEDANFEEKAQLTVQDLNGDGRGEGLLVVTWTRPVRSRLKGACEAGPCFVETVETVEQLHVIALQGAKLSVVATHLVSYASQSSASEEIDAVPDAESVRYAWHVADGPPPRIAFERTELSLSKRRLKGLLDPGRDPLASARARGDLAVPLAVQK